MRKKRPRRWWPRVVVLVLGAVASVGAGDDVTRTSASGAAPASAATRGQALFSGAAALTGRIRGHQSGLPPEVVRCANCHRVDGRAPTPGAAPTIDRALLLDTRLRRGGPPSAYDETSFCRLLRTGVDPVYVLIAREMPTYDIDDGRCADIWRFLTEAKR